MSEAYERWHKAIQAGEVLDRILNIDEVHAVLDAEEDIPFLIGPEGRIYATSEEALAKAVTIHKTRHGTKPPTQSAPASESVTTLVEVADKLAYAAERYQKSVIEADYKQPERGYSLKQALAVYRTATQSTQGRGTNCPTGQKENEHENS